MIQLDEALEIIRSNAQICGTETVSLEDANGRVLAQDILYDRDMPPFDKSAMDGFACRREDLGAELTIVETVFAGKSPKRTIGRKECARIMTGAVVPDGADCVFMKEDASETGENTVICTSVNTRTNICIRGEDALNGDVVLQRSTILEAKHIPVMAGAGVSNPEVFKQPSVVVMATGTELVEPGDKPMPFQIRNSNSPQLMAQLGEVGIRANYGGIIPDEASEMKERITSSLEESDLLIITGGVSVSEYDLIPGILKESGFEILMSRMAIHPGKPVVFARKGERYCFGLAGNPVSSFLQFRLFILPLIYFMMGTEFQPERRIAILTRPYSRKKTERLRFLPGLIDDQNEVVPVEYHGSAHINSLTMANCLIEIPIGTSEIEQGGRVYVRPV